MQRKPASRLGEKQPKEQSMKFLFAVAAAGILSSLTAITPANAQKDPACTEKCNRQNTAAGGGQQTRGTGEAVRACIASCPPAKKK
jgi:hypothetical protein